MIVMRMGVVFPWPCNDADGSDGENEDNDRSDDEKGTIKDGDDDGNKKEEDTMGVGGSRVVFDAFKINQVIILIELLHKKDKQH